jgi:hypothetical protein
VAGVCLFVCLPGRSVYLPRPILSVLVGGNMNQTIVANAQQREAVEAGLGANAISAGPGSGKTRTIVFRAKYLMAQGVSPANVLAVTFSKRAASEIEDRMNLAFGDLTEFTVGTFHAIGFCCLCLVFWSSFLSLLTERVFFCVCSLFFGLPFLVVFFLGRGSWLVS